MIDLYLQEFLLVDELEDNNNTCLAERISLNNVP
jgi:hypothetical protein